MVKKMQGFQFARLEVYSAKGAPGAKPDQIGKRKNGDRAWTAAQVMDEAERVALASEHIIPGRPGPELLPGASKDFPSLRAAHAAAASVKETFAYTKKDGAKQKRKRKLRADAATLYSSIYTLPIKAADALADPELAEMCRTVLTRAMAFETGRIKAFGGSVELGVIHWDEEFVHIHILALDRKRGRVDLFHPGRVAKKAFHAEHRDEKDRGTANKAGNKAYRDAMSGWQDDVFEAVSKRAGLLRFGPRRARLSRAEYKAAKVAAESRVEDEKRLAELNAKVAKEKVYHEKLRDAAREIEKRDKESRAREADTAEAFEKASGLKASAEAKARAIVEGMAAVDERVLDYAEATPEKPHGLVYGPKAPKDKKQRKRLRDRLRPAYDVLLSYARRVFNIRKAEERLARLEGKAHERAEALEAQRAEFEEHRQREEVKQRAKANVLAEAYEKIWNRAPAAIRMILDPGSVEVDEKSFPDAWAVPHDAEPKWVRASLDRRTNLDLRALASANRDAVLLSDEAPELQARFKRGLTLAVAEAKARGFDLETGRHHPEKAKDAARANLHTDQLPKPVLVRQTVRERQRTRT